MTVSEVLGDSTRGVSKARWSKLFMSGVGHDGDLQTRKYRGTFDWNTKIGTSTSVSGIVTFNVLTSSE